MIENIIRIDGKSTAFDVTVSPGSQKDQIYGVDVWRKRLIVKMKEQPIEGRANLCVVNFFSGLFGIPDSRVEIVAGARSRHKTILVHEELGRVKEVLEQNLGKD